jgi:transcriptional regulator with XRE-family HTH domain
MPHSLSKSRRRSSASLILDRLGVSQAQLAEVLGVSKSSLSRVLAGRQPVPADLEPVLRGLLGSRDAARVVAAIEQARP